MSIPRPDDSLDGIRGRRGAAVGGLCAAMVLAGVVLSACAAPRSTRLTAADLDQTVHEVARQLADSDFLRRRGPDSPPIIITAQRVVNLTSDLIPPAEQWMMVNRVLASLPVRTMANQKNIRFQLAPEAAAMLREHGWEAAGSAAAEPTHLLSAEFRSATRAGSLRAGPTDVRSESYWLEFRITEVRSRNLAWSGAFELRREARGLTID